MASNIRRNYKIAVSRVNQRVPSPGIVVSPGGGYKIKDPNKFAYAFVNHYCNSEYGDEGIHSNGLEKCLRDFLTEMENRKSPFKFFPDNVNIDRLEESPKSKDSIKISSPKNDKVRGFVPISVHLKQIYNNREKKHIQNSDVNIDNNNSIIINDSEDRNADIKEVTSYQRDSTDEAGDRWLERMSGDNFVDNAGNVKKSITGLKGFWNPSSNNDFRTQHKPNNKGAACLLFSRRFDCYGNQKLYVLLPLEKHGKYATTYNMFGGHFESSKDIDIQDTVRRELKEEYGDAILSWVDWKGSYWSFNRSYIEFGSLPEKFDTRGFIENNEISKCNWFSVDDILNSPSETKEIDVDGKIQKLKYYRLEDSEGNIFRISTYAHGVLTAAKKNKHFYIHEVDHTQDKQSNVFSRYLSN